MTNCIKNSDLVDFWLCVSSTNKIPELYKFVKAKIGDSSPKKEVLMRKIRFFDIKMKKNWTACKCNRQFFEKTYAMWLNWIFLEPEKVSCICKKIKIKLNK